LSQGHYFQHLLEKCARFIVSVEQYLTCIGRILYHLAKSHALPAGSREGIVAFQFISEGTVLACVPLTYSMGVQTEKEIYFQQYISASFGHCIISDKPMFLILQL
jgi:hypothetical protein